MRPGDAPLAITAPPAAWKARRSALVTVPGEAVSAFLCPVPAGLKESAARNVALNAARDMVAGAADAHHFVAVPGEGGTRTVLAMAIADLESWRATAAQHGTRVSALVPDYLALPWKPGQVTLHLPSADRLVVRTGRATGFAGERALVEPMLDLFRLQSGADITEIALAPGEGDARAALSETLSRWTLPIVDAADAPPPPPVDLLARESVGLASTPRARRRLALVAAAFAGLALWAGSAQMDLAEDRATLAAARAANIDVARDAFGLTGPILDMRVQIERAIAGLEAAADDNAPRMGFPELLARSGPVLAAPERDVAEMSYQEDALRFVVSVADFAALDGLRSALERAGLRTEISRSVGSGSTGVEAVLVVADPQGGPG
ncbi:MAG: type II secretion system protein GspL [Pseudomonadota bacterium]